MSFNLIIAFLVGGGFGAMASYLLLARSKAETSIEKQLRELQEEFTAYRENVNSHFNKTAELVNTLTENYIAVQSHLEDAADSLAEPPKSFQLDSNLKLPQKKTKFVSLEVKPKDDDTGVEDANFESNDNTRPPLDYAPKSGSKEIGTLAEEYGLHHPQHQQKR